MVATEKVWTENEILDIIARADRKSLFKMLWALFERQTSDEQTSEATRYRNGVGFSGRDSGFLTSVAKGAKKYGAVSSGQEPYVRKALIKYRRQLLDIANENERKGKMAPGTEDDIYKPWGGRFAQVQLPNPYPNGPEVVAVPKPEKTAAVIEQEMHQMVADNERKQEQKAFTFKMNRDAGLLQTWEDVFGKPCQHEWQEYSTRDIPMLERKFSREYNFTPGLSMRGCHNQVCTKCGAYQFIDSSD